MPLAESKEWLTDKLFADYDFVTNGDLSRAVAQVISPALKIGGLLGNVDYPMDFGLANKSQSGKSHRSSASSACHARVYAGAVGRSVSESYTSPNLQAAETASETENSRLCRFRCLEILTAPFCQKWAHL